MGRGIFFFRAAGINNKGVTVKGVLALKTDQKYCIVAKIIPYRTADQTAMEILPTHTRHDIKYRRDRLVWRLCDQRRQDRYVDAITDKDR
jgi:hypothetical protein